MPSTTNDDGRPVIQSVDRAVDAMEILARDGWCSVTDLARELEIHKSTVFRLLATLHRRGMVEQDRATQHYRLGITLVRLAASVSTSVDLLSAGREACEQLALATGETVNLAVLQRREVVHIHQVNRSSHRVGVDWIGSHTSLHNTSSGKVLLAHLPVRDRRRLLQGELEASTVNTITDPEQLLAELEAVAADGYATTIEELEEGLNAVAAPVRGLDGQVVACVSVSGPSYRLDAARLAAMAADVVAAADAVSAQLGHRAGPDAVDETV